MRILKEAIVTNLDKYVHTAMPVDLAPQRHDVPPLSETYKLSLEVSVTFVANRAQYSDAERAAARVLTHKICGNMLASLDLVQHAIFMGDMDSGRARNTMTQ